MDLPINHFKRAITSGRTPLGAWLGSGAPSTAEALGCAGFDFLVVDMEHTPIDTPQMIDILRAIAGTPAQAIVRPPWNDMVMVKRALDAGAQTLLLPFVQDADEARRAVASTRYPPEGVRGVAGTHRGSRYGTVAELSQARERGALRDRADRDAAGARQARRDRRGPRRRFDLHRAERPVGIDGPPRRHRATRRCRRIWRPPRSACRRAGKPSGIIGPTPDMVARFIDYGYSWIAIGSDMGFMVGRAQEYLGRFRSATAATAGKPEAPADARRRPARLVFL